MAQKSISEFRAENNVKLTELAEMTGISEEELARADSLKPVPWEIEKIIIDEYDLPRNYFSGVPLPADIPKHYTISDYLGLSFVWLLCVSLIASFVPIVIPFIIYTLNSLTKILSENALDFTVKAVGSIGLVIAAAVFVLGCKWLANRLEKVHGFTPDKRKYTYLYYIIPSGVASLFNLLCTLISKLITEDMFGPVIAFNSVYSIVGTALTVIILALMLKSVKNGEKDIKILNTLYKVFAVCTAVLIALRIAIGISSGTFTELSGVLGFIIGRAEEIIGLVIVFGLIKEKERNEKEEKLLFNTLPLITLLVLPICGAVVTLIK